MSKKRKSQRTPLFFELFEAAARGLHLSIPDLVRQGADPLQTEPESKSTPLQIAAENEHLPAVQILLPLSDPNTQDIEGTTPLMSAARGSSPDSYAIFQTLLPHSNPHAIDRSGRSVLHYAATGNSPLTIQAALLFCDPNLPDINGNTPLHSAAISRASNHLLLATPQNIHHKNKYGHTPADIFHCYNHTKEAAELTNFATSISEQNTLQQTLPNPAPASPRSKL